MSVKPPTRWNFHQAELKKIASQIGNLKHKRAEINKQYEIDKAWFHRKYREEKHAVTASIHALRMEYLTVNGVQDVCPAKLTPPTTDGQPNDGGTE